MPRFSPRFLRFFSAIFPGDSITLNRVCFDPRLGYYDLVKSPYAKSYATTPCIACMYGEYERTRTVHVMISNRRRKGNYRISTNSRPVYYFFNLVLTRPYNRGRSCIRGRSFILSTQFDPGLLFLATQFYPRSSIFFYTV